MEIGFVGKPNVGKSTLFESSTMAGAQIANYPFTTIKANKGMGFIRGRCPHLDLNVKCEPRNAACIDGTRFIPVELLDVAGLVPDAHSGKGLGNQFLDDLRQASALVNVIDVSGSTDIEGNPVDPGTHDPSKDIDFLMNEIDHWMNGIIMRDWHRLSKHSESQHDKIDKLLFERLTGLGITQHHVTEAIHKLDLDPKPTHWKDEDLFALSSALRTYSKPMLIAANKADRASDDMLEEFASKVKGTRVVFTCAEAELALRRASKAGLIEYRPGDPEFKVLDRSKLSDAQIKGLEKIREVLVRFGSTNVQKVLEVAAYDLLGLITVYPVEDEHKFTDQEGRVLPDVHLVRKGSTARDVGFKVHTDLGDHFIKAIDCRTQRTIGSDHEVRDGDVIKIHANA